MAGKKKGKANEPQTIIKENEVVFYGQDFSSIDEAYVCWKGKEDKTIRKEPIKGDPFLREALWIALENINAGLVSKNGIILVGRTLGEVGDSTQLSICSKVQKKNTIVQMFGNLVGTVRSKIRYDEAGLINAVNEILSREDEENYDKENEEERKTKWKEYCANSKFSSLYGRFLGEGARKMVSVKIEIFSRFDYLNEDLKVRPYFMASLLLKGRIVFNDLQVPFDFYELFDFYLLCVLIKHFKDALRKGFYKQYQRFESNSNRLRGSIDIARHIRLNMNINNGRVACSYRENSTDNMINHLVLAAFDHLREKYPALVDANVSDELAAKIKYLKYDIGYPKYGKRTIVAKNSTPISHPYFTEYKELQKDCLMILRDESVSPFENKKESLSGILYYVPDLWEDFLTDFISRDLDLTEDDITLQTQFVIRAMTDREDSEGHVTRPDFVFWYYDEDRKEDVPFFILDAKYRPAWINALKGYLDPMLSGDYDKCLRDMVSIDGNACGVMFPVQESEKDSLKGSLLHRFSKYNSYGRFYTFPILIPRPKMNEEMRFDEWEEQLRNKIREYIKYLTGDQETGGALKYELEYFKVLSEMKEEMRNLMDEVEYPNYDL